MYSAMIESAADGKNTGQKRSNSARPLSIGPSFFDHVCPLSSDNKHGWQRVCAGLGQCFMRESVARTHHDQCDSVIKHQMNRFHCMDFSDTIEFQQKPPFDVVNRKLFLIPFHHVHPFSSQSLVYIEFNSSFHFHFDMF